MSLENKIKIPPVGLLAIATGLILIHLTLNWKADRYSHLAMSILFWLAALSVVDDNRYQLKYGSDLWSSCLGAEPELWGFFLKVPPYPREISLVSPPSFQGWGWPY